MKDMNEQLSPAGVAWREWFQEYGPRLLLFARQQTNNYQDAEDVLQDAVVRLVHKLDSGTFIGGQEAWMPFLYTAIRRLAIDLSRSTQRRHKREDIAVMEDVLNEEGSLLVATNEEVEYMRERLEASLKSLPPKFAEVVIMKIWGERTFQEIGEALDISPNTAASRYRYGLDSLKKDLGIAKMQGNLAI